MAADLREQLQSTLGSAYTIERELGGGGMSRVFVALDVALGRRVVVKVLPPETAGSVSAERFKREIHLAAQLQHAHIVPLLSAGDSQGVPFYTMPLVEGETLRERVARQGELPVREAVKILRDVASALAYAHSHGVAHRDIKPENVLLTEYDALVTDFGVAKALSASAATSGSGLTSLGVALGTPAYMAPEQAVADPATDHRADLYALGIMGWEMLAGHAPFAGRTPQQMMAAHASEAPPSLDVARPGLPTSLATMVMQCMAKRPADRPQTAAEVVQTLDAIATPTPASTAPHTAPAAALPRPSGRRTTTILAGLALVAVAASGAWIWSTRGGSVGAARAGAPNSIAVLPFENEGGDTAMAFFADGMADELATALTRVPGLHVAARASTIAFAGRQVGVGEIGRTLHVKSVLYGRVRRAGNRLRVWTQLVNANDQSAIWTGTYDTTLADVFGVQDNLARSIVTALRVSLTGGAVDDKAARAPRGTDDLEAYDLFLQGRYYHQRLGIGTVRSIDFFKRAIARDPKFARAHAELAFAYSTAVIFGEQSRDSLLGLARESLDRALANDSTLTTAQLAKAAILNAEWRFAETESVLRHLLAREPDNSDAGNLLAVLAGTRRRPEETLALTGRVLENDPFAVSTLLSRQYWFVVARRYRDAIAITPRILGLDSTSVFAYQNLGLAYAFLGIADSALMAFQTGYRINPNMVAAGAFLTFGYAVAGRWDDAERERSAERRRARGNSPDFSEVLLSIAFGEWDAAVRALERGVDRREPLLLTQSLGCDPTYDPLKSDPRFVALMRRTGITVCDASGKWPIAARKAVR